MFQELIARFNQVAMSIAFVALDLNISLMAEDHEDAELLDAVLEFHACHMADIVAQLMDLDPPESVWSEMLAIVCHSDDLIAICAFDPRFEARYVAEIAG